MTLPPSLLEIIVSARAARHLRIKPVRAMSPEPAHCLTQWRAEVVDDSEGGHWFLVTNMATLYTFMIPRKPTSRFPSLIADFKVRLGFALLGSTPPLEWQPSEIVPVRGNPRAVIGTMNDMAAHVAWPRTPEHKRYYSDMEASLQDTPFSAIGAKGQLEFPSEVWLQRLNELAAGPQSDPTVQ